MSSLLSPTLKIEVVLNQAETNVGLLGLQFKTENNMAYDLHTGYYNMEAITYRPTRQLT